MVMSCGLPTPDREDLQHNLQPVSQFLGLFLEEEDLIRPNLVFILEGMNIYRATYLAMDLAMKRESLSQMLSSKKELGCTHIISNTTQSFFRELFVFVSPCVFA